MAAKAAFFDFDGTMIPGDSIVALVLKARKERILSLGGLFKTCACTVCAGMKLIPTEKAKACALRFLTALPEDRRERFLHGFMADTLKGRLFQRAVERIRQHKKDGFRIVIVSASPLCYMRHIKEILPVDLVLATPFDTRTGQIAYNMRGQKKADVLLSMKETFNLQESFAYGNSSHDLPMLRLVGHPVCVNAIRSLQKKAPAHTVFESWG